MEQLQLQLFISQYWVTEHDTFRSNQIREGQLTRDEAFKLQLKRIARYQNIKWYLDTISIDL